MGAGKPRGYSRLESALHGTRRPQGPCRDVYFVYLTAPLRGVPSSENFPGPLYPGHWLPWELRCSLVTQRPQYLGTALILRGKEVGSLLWND